MRQEKVQRYILIDNDGTTSAVSGLASRVAPAIMLMLIKGQQPHISSITTAAQQWQNPRARSSACRLR
jgi:hypothetical protein